MGRVFVLRTWCDVQIRTLIAGFLGFMMFKVAVLGVAAMPLPSDDVPAHRRW